MRNLCIIISIAVFFAAAAWICIRKVPVDEEYGEDAEEIHCLPHLH